MFFIEAKTRRHLLRPADNRLLLWCFALSLALHAALLQWMPELRSTHEAPARPLTVELARPEPPIVAQPPKPEPARVVTPVKPQLQQQPKPEPRPQPRTEEKAPAVLAIPPVTAAPAETPPPAFTVPEPVTRAPEPPRASAPPAAPTPAPRVRTDAAYLHNPAAYPLAARRRGEQGTVMIRVTVSAEGLPTRVSLEKTSGTPALDEAALNAVRAWRFVPARDGGQAVEALYIVPVVYKLN